MLQLVLRLRFHLLTIAISLFAGILVYTKWHQPHFFEREGRYLLGLPALVACATWFRSFMGHVVDGSTVDAPVFFFLLEKLLVAYLAFGLGFAIFWAGGR